MSTSIGGNPALRTPAAAAVPEPSANVQNAAMLATAYFAIAGAGHALSPGDDAHGFFWLPAGLLVATLLLAPRSSWLALLLGAFVGDAAFGLGHDLAPAAMVTRFGSTALQALLGALAVERFLRSPFRVTSSRDLLWFLFLTAPAAALVASVVAVAAIGGFEDAAGFARNLWPRWGSNAMGVLLLAPHMLAWSGPTKTGLGLGRRSRQIEGVLLVVTAVASVVIVFELAGGIRSPLRLLLAAPVIWAAMRFGLRGVATVNLALALPVAFFTGAALALESRPETTGLGQTLIALLVVIGLMLALVIQESRAQLEALGRSEEFFRAVIEDQTEMLVRWKPDGTRTFVNEAYCRVTGQPGAALLGTSFLPMLAESDQKVLQARVGALTPQNPVAVAIHHLFLVDGTPSWLEWTDRGIFDAGGELVELQSTGRDITQRLSDELKIRRLSRLYASLSAVNHAVLGESDAGSFLAATCRILVDDGGLLLAAVGRADSGAHILEPVARAGAASDFLDAVEVRLDGRDAPPGPAATAVLENRPYICNDLSLDPRAKPWQSSASSFGIAASAAFPIRCPDGVWGVLAIYAGEVDFFDEDELQLLEEIADNISFALENFSQELVRSATQRALRESERRFRTMMEYSPIGMAVVATDGRWIDVNPALCRIVGYDREELLCIDFQTITHPDDLENDLRMVRRVLDGELDNYQLEKRYLRKTGETIWIQLDVVLVQSTQNEGAYFLVKIQDITDRKDAENRILELNATLERRVAERTRELEAANRELELANGELESFSAAVSHDLRSPLRLIEGFSKMLSDGHIDPEDTEGLDDLARIRSAVRRMEDRINGMLRLARLTRGPLQREKVDLSSIAHETIATLRTEEPDRPVRVRIQPGLVVRGSATLLRAVLENLLGNALKFTSHVADAEIEFGQGTRGGIPMLYVRDNGAGFSMQQADRLFRAFQRLHGEDEFPGTGIGLVTVQRIVQRHGGTIEAESQVNEGACFWFTVPDRDDGDNRQAASA